MATTPPLSFFVFALSLWALYMVPWLRPWYWGAFLYAFRTSMAASRVLCVTCFVPCTCCASVRLYI